MDEEQKKELELFGTILSPEQRELWRKHLGEKDEVDLGREVLARRMYEVTIHKSATPIAPPDPPQQPFCRWAWWRREKQFDDYGSKEQPGDKVNSAEGKGYSGNWQNLPWGGGVDWDNASDVLKGIEQGLQVLNLPSYAVEFLKELNRYDDNNGLTVLREELSKLIAAYGLFSAPGFKGSGYDAYKAATTNLEIAKDMLSDKPLVLELPVKLKPGDRVVLLETFQFTDYSVCYKAGTQVIVEYVEGNKVHVFTQEERPFRFIVPRSYVATYYFCESCKHYKVAGTRQQCWNQKSGYKGYWSEKDKQYYSELHINAKITMCTGHELDYTRIPGLKGKIEND